MTTMRLHYVYDPLCGWCYAATPLVNAVVDAGIPLVLHGGGLWDRPTGIDPDKREHIRRSDARIAELTGMPFGPAYLDGLLHDPSLRLWSRPAIAAVLAAGRLAPDAEMRMLHAIHHAHYVEARRVIEPSVLVDLGRSIGVSPEAFGTEIEAVAVDDHIAASRRWMAEIGLRGFPGFVLERDGGLVRIAHESFYGRPEAFLRKLEALGQHS